MNDLPQGPDVRHGSDLDSLLREAMPEIKLAVGELIDRENSRPLPGKYARLLPESLLIVTLRPDAAEALASMAAAVERELTDSCNRHGSLYDRGYRVQLRQAADHDVPLYTVASVAGHSGPAGELEEAAPHGDLPAVQADRAATSAGPALAAAQAAPIPLYDPDATRLDDQRTSGWQPGRWLLLVEGLEGEEREAFRLTEPFVTVGRRSDDPVLRTTVALSDVPHVSRRQLAFLWEERDGAPGFKVFNLGLNPIHVADREVQGAHVPRGPLDLERVPETSTVWLPPGVPLRIGDQGPVLRIEEVPKEEPEEAAEEWEDPDATRYG